MATDQSDVTQGEIRDYTLLTQTIFPAELDRTAEISPGQDRDLQQGNSTRWPAAARSVDRSAVDFEMEIVALAHRINREKNLVKPTVSSAGPVRDGTAPRSSSRYPQIPLDEETEHAVIWRTTEATAENLQNTRSAKRKFYTPTTLDDDLEPALPPGLTRDVTEWMNRVMMNLAARTPVFRGPRVKSNDKPDGSSDLPMLGWQDVLKAIDSDVQDSDEKKLNEKIRQRVKARFAGEPVSAQQDVSREAGSANVVIDRLRERQAVLDQSLKRRQALEQSLWDENEGLDRRDAAQRKRYKAGIRKSAPENPSV